MKRFGMIQRDEGYPTEMVECDDGPFVLFDEVESRESLAVSAAVMAEREAICAHLSSERMMPKDRPASGFDLYSWERGVEDAIDYIRSRPSPAVDVLGDALRKHDRLWCEALIASGDLRVIEAVTKYVIERRPESARSLVDGAPKAEANGGGADHG